MVYIYVYIYIYKVYERDEVVVARLCRVLLCVDLLPHEEQGNGRLL